MGFDSGSITSERIAQYNDHYETLANELLQSPVPHLFVNHSCPTEADIASVNKHITRLTENIDAIDTIIAQAPFYLLGKLANISGKLHLARTAHRSCLSAVRMLPAEVLLEIFQWCQDSPTPLLDLLRASWVCGSWRVAILHTSALWTKVDLTFPTRVTDEDVRMEMVSEILRRSAGRPLDLHLRFSYVGRNEAPVRAQAPSIWDILNGDPDFDDYDDSDDYADDFWFHDYGPPLVAAYPCLEPVLDQCHRWRTLHIDADRAPLPSFITRAPASLQQLTALTLTGRRGGRADLFSAVRYFCSAPLLTSVTNNCLSVSQELLRLPPSLTVYTSTDDYGIFGVLRTQPSLHTLVRPSVSGGVGHLTIPFIPNHTTQMEHPGLKRLHLLDADVDDIFLNYSLPNLEELCFEDGSSFLAHQAERASEFLQVAAQTLTTLFLGTTLKDYTLPELQNVLGPLINVNILGLSEQSDHPIFYEDFDVLPSVLIVRQSGPTKAILPQLEILHYEPYSTKMSMYLRSVKIALCGVIASRHDDPGVRTLRRVVVGKCGTFERECGTEKEDMCLEGLEEFGVPFDAPPDEDDGEEEETEVVLDYEGVVPFWPDPYRLF